MTYSAFEKHREAVREVEMRRRVYPNQIDKGLVTSDIAFRRIAIMEEIAEHFRELAEKERLL